MRKGIFYTLILAVLCAGFWSCKSEYERIRTSGDAALMLQAADAYFNEGEYLRAQSLYELVLSSYRGRAEAEQIAFNYAYTYYHLEQYTLAAYYFNNFANTYGASRFQEEAAFMNAYSNYKESPTFRLEQSSTLKAIEAFEEFVNKHPNSERVAECNRLIDEMRLKLEIKDLESAKLYFNLQEYQAAIRSFENLLIDYPETRQAEYVRFMTVRAAYLLAENSFVEKQAERYAEVLKHGTTFRNRHGNSEYSGEVQKMIVDSETRIKQLDNVRY